MKENGVSVSGKFATQLSTSKHFYDITAHNYIRDNCFDMGFKYIKGLSADMDDLLSEKGRKESEALKTTASSRFQKRPPLLKKFWRPFRNASKKRPVTSL